MEKCSRRLVSVGLGSMAAYALLNPRHALAQVITAPSEPNKEVKPKTLRCRIHYWHEIKDMKTFEDYAYELREEKMYPIAVRDAESYVRGGEPNWPEDEEPVIMTFDDALLSQYKYAFPVLRAWSLRGTFYVLLDYQDGDHDYMTKEQIKEIADQGLEIGSHGYSHQPLKDIRTSDPDQFHRDVVQSKAELEQITGQEIVSFAYPFGRNGVDPETISEVAKHYRCAVTTGGEAPILTADNIHAWPRYWRS